jgi:hypothetical protein
LNKWSWNLHRESISCIPDIALYIGFAGPQVLPGRYRARISIGDFEDTAEFTVAQDPRSTASDDDVRDWGSRLTELSDLVSEMLTHLDSLRTARTQVQGLLDSHVEDEQIRWLAGVAIEKIGAWEAKITQLKHKTLEDEDAWETMLAGQLRYLLAVIDQTGAPVTEGAIARLNDLQAEWSEREAELVSIAEENLKPINTWAKEQGVNHVRMP